MTMTKPTVNKFLGGGGSWKTPPSLCSYCDYMIDEATPHLDNSRGKPTPGSISICPSCAQILVFNDDLTLRVPKVGEIQMNSQIEEFQKAVRSAGRGNLLSQQGGA